MKCLVTGGLGYIGSNLVEKLIDGGYDVRVIDNKSSNFNNCTTFKDAEYFFIDLKNYDKITPIFNGIDVVFHLASDVSIDYCLRNPRESCLNNSIINTNVLEASRINNIKKLIFSSTSAVYKCSKKPVSENSEISGNTTTYGASKILGESLCRIYSDLYGLNTIILRYFNVFGKNSNISEYSSVLNKFFDLYKKNEPLLVNGGQQTRDFIHVEDVVDCNIKCAEFTSSGNLTYNVGTGKSYTIDYIAKQISQNILYKDYRSNDILYSESNIDKIKKDLKWSPRIDIIKYINEEKNRIANHSYK